MDTKPQSTNKLMRYLAPIIGLGVAAVFLYQQFGPAPLPKCDDSEAQSVLQDLVKQTEPAAQPAKLDGVEQINEASFDEARELRTCAALAKFEGGAEEKLRYTVSWNDKDEKEFLVELQRLPQCDGSDAQDTLKQIIEQLEQPGTPARTLSAVGQISPSGFDPQAEIRSCTAVATFADGAEQKLSYVVRWKSPEAKEYAVEAQYVP